MRVGILGGSFNPPHRGHLALARTVLEQGLADTVLLIPAAVPPHKAAPREADAATRLEMTRLLATEDARLSVCGIELDRAGPSFTVDTVGQLRMENPGVQYRLIIGSDMAKIFATWRNYRELLTAAPPLVAERPDSLFDASSAENYGSLSPEEIAVLERGRFAMEPVPVSSTLVRDRLADGADDDEILRYLTEPVLRYIRENGLYC